MTNAERIGKVGYLPTTELTTSEKRRRVWFGVLCLSAVGGFLAGIAGLCLSLMAFCEMLEKTRALSLAVSMLIVSSLGLLLFAAHAMDRTSER